MCQNHRTNRKYAYFKFYFWSKYKLSKLTKKKQAQKFYVRGCLRDIEVVREDIPTVRENGCWTVDGEYVGWGRNIFIETDKTVYCFCDERDGCNRALSLRHLSPINFLLSSFAFILCKFLFF